MSIIGFIVVGDTTSHGGTVITGDPTWTIDGIPVARVGDTVFCPLCQRTTVIVSSRFPTLTDNGMPAAYDQDHTDCGAVLYSRHNGHVGWDDGGAESGAAITAPSAAAASAVLVASADPAVAFAALAASADPAAPADGMMYASLTETQKGAQKTECAHLLEDIQREKENIKKIDKAIKEWKEGQSPKDYGLVIDATPEGYRGKQYQTSSNGYKKAVEELEANTTIIDRLSRFHIKDWIPFLNDEVEMRKRWLAVEKERSEFVLHKMEQIYGKDCKQGIKT
jgi:uncharacterized Zn-binding protein involved in type VI secretion